MSKPLLTIPEARALVDAYIGNETRIPSTQEIIDSGAIPRLNGYKVRPGKVSDSIFAGSFEYKGTNYENPPLNTADETPLRLMIRTARVSTHDIVRGEIPFKDQILASIHNSMRKRLQGAIGTSQYEVPGLADNAVVIAAEDLEQIRFENVLRAYAARSSTSTSLFVHYFEKGARRFCGHDLPEGLVPNGPLPYVMDTPSTKSDEHDVSLAPETMFRQGLVSRSDYAQIRNGSIFGFGIVDQILRPLGIIAVDTKTEHGRNRKREIVSQDEIWTLDSSRFWLASDWKTQYDLFTSGEEADLVRYLQETQPGIKEKEYTFNGRVVMAPKSYSKEFARGFSKGDDGYTDDQRAQIAVRYIEAYQLLLGKRFEPDMRQREERVVSGLNTIVNNLVARN